MKQTATGLVTLSVTAESHEVQEAGRSLLTAEKATMHEAPEEVTCCALTLSRVEVRCMTLESLPRYLQAD